MLHMQKVIVTQERQLNGIQWYPLIHIIAGLISGLDEAFKV